MRILNAIFKPSTKFKRMVEILSNINQNVRFTAFQDYMLHETINPVHGVSTLMLMSAALFQTYDFDANYPHWSAIINANEFLNLINLINEDDEKVKISVEVDQQHARILFLFYDMDGVVRLHRMMDCQPIGGGNYSEAHYLMASIIEAHGLRILMSCRNDFKNALKCSSNHTEPVEIRITNDMIVVSSDPAICFLDKGTEDYMTNDFPREYSIVQVSVYEAKYIADTASVAELCMLRVITNETSALALPLLLEFILERDHVVYFTLPSGSVARPQLI